MAALYQRAKFIIADAIRDGDFAVGEILPPVEQLAERADCSTETVRRAVKELAQDGVVKSVRRKGTVVLRAPTAGRICMLLERDEHCNVIFQEPLCRHFINANFDVDLIPSVGEEDMTRWVERLRQDAQNQAFLVSLNPFASRKLKHVLDRFAFGVQVDITGTCNISHDKLCTVGVNRRQEARLLVAHLRELGHKRIAIFSGHDSGEHNTGFQETAEYCKDLMEVAGGAFFPFYITDGKSKIIDFVRNEGVTACVEINDHQAVSTIIACERAGLRVPEDLSVVGRNDTPWSRTASPTLTTVSLNPIGFAEAIISLFTGTPEDGYPHNISVEPHLVVRESTTHAKTDS